MGKPIVFALLICLILFVDLNAAARSGSLDKFLNSTERSERKAAYLDILKNKEAYIDQIQEELGAFQRNKDRRFHMLSKLLYLAAIIRSEKFINPLWKMFNDYDYLGYECVYCCPIVLTLTLYASLDKENDMSHDLRERMRREIEKKDIKLVREHSRWPYGSPESQKLISKMELLSVGELIKMAGPENTDRTQRYNATYVLGLVVIDDKNLSDLYWLAIEDMPDASGIYLCNVYEAIERAERARAQKKVQIH
jgi:hypothetical protein